MSQKRRLPGTFRLKRVLAVAALIGLAPSGSALPARLQGAATAEPNSDALAAARAQMVAQVHAELRSAHVRDDARLRAILQVLASLPREAYVPADQRASAYAPSSVPIGHGQTMSDAFIMAYMTHALDVRPGQRVLEIGTGSGYQAAILGSLGARVYTIEIVPELARQASAVLQGQGFRNVSVRQGDGYAGWPEAAPFDAIIVTAGAVRIPPALVAQLRPGGRMILPLGPNWAEQQMTMVRKGRDGRIDVRSCGWVAFVPFVGEAQRLEPGASPVWGGRLSPRCRAPIGARFQLGFRPPEPS
jgi:protein-L-isoaspartate(D-aspartate) O-methyltransferase